MSRARVKLLGVAAACCLALVPACSRAPDVYYHERVKGDTLALHKDGKFSLRESGRTISGAYRIKGSEIVLVTEEGDERAGRIEGGVLYDPHGNLWVKR
jgi:hypothetical protein